MKLKGLPPRVYNILFHTHTVSGIVISVALYIIFFAGAFTLFREEFYQWENPKARTQKAADLNLEATLKAIHKSVPNVDWNEDLRLMMPSQENPFIKVFGHLKKEKGAEEEHFHLNIHPATLVAEAGDATTIGETLYRLHFLDQLPVLGRYLAGFVSLFFLFATLTGVLIHWRNMSTKLWAFSLKNSWKQLWTNAHTVFGLLGLPFQLMYAVTGAFYLLLILILLPSVMVFYKGDTRPVYALVQPALGVKYNENSPSKNNQQSLLTMYQQAKEMYPGFSVWYLSVNHLHKADAVLNVNFKSKDVTKFDIYGGVGFRLETGKKLYEMIPGKNKTYVQQVLNGMGQLHFGTFGGLLVKTLYFLMALFTCFVIISGVLLWKEARKNKNYTAEQQHFHQRVTTLYLACCLGLFPATPVLFMAELVFPMGKDHVFWVNTVFFGTWLLFFLLGVWAKSESKMVQLFLLLGGGLSIAVSLTNGFTTGDWVWVSWMQHNYFVFGTDVFWLLIGLLLLIVKSLDSPYLSVETKRKRQQEDKVSV